MIDFKKDLYKETVKKLDKYGIKYKSKDKLYDLLIKLNSFWNKYIIPQKRTVLLSKELLEKRLNLTDSTQNALAKMMGWIENGIDINCFQSRGLYGHGSRDYQNMIYDIVHLHLSPNKNDELPIVKKNGFAKPGEYLLYAYFDDKNAYFIDIDKHPDSLKKEQSETGKWTSKNIVKIISDNWPKLMKSKKIDGAYLCDNDGNPIYLDDEAIAQLTSNHINTFVELNGALYMPGFGVTGSGDSVKASLEANRMIKQALIAQKYYEENEEKLHREFNDILAKHNRPIPENFDIHYEWAPFLKKFAIVDGVSRITWDYQCSKIYLLTE